MSERIFTLFGEELLPDPVSQSTRGKSKKKQESKAEKPESNEPDTTEVEIATVAETVLQQANTPPVETKAPPLEKEPDPLPDDWKGDKQYYTIGETATLLGVKTSNIRFWTTEFKLKVRTNRKGDRLYTPAQVKELKAIYHLVKERGFTLNGAKTRLKAKAGKDVETIDLRTQLISLRSKLIAIKNKLK